MTEILILGTGALASYFGARLAAAGSSVIMLGTWLDGIHALQEDGIRLVANGDQRIYQVRAISDAALLQDISTALVLVKSWQTQRAAEQLSEVLLPEGIALTLQNGLGNLEILSDQLGKERTALGVTTTGATLLGPGRVRAGGEGKITLGTHPRLRAIKDALSAADFNLEETGDLESILWSKLVLNAAINPLTALLDVPNGKLLESIEARALMSALVSETAGLADAKEISLTYHDPSKAVEEVASATADNISSMLQDIRRGAPTEIDAINGAIVAEAHRMGFSVPVNEIICKLIRAKVELGK